MTESSSEDDVPLASSPPKKRVNGATTKLAKVKAEDSDADDDSVHINGTKRRASTNGKARKPPKKKIKEETPNSDGGKPSVPKKAPGSRKRKLKAEEADEDAMSDDQPKKPKAKPRSKKVKQEEASDTETPQPKKRVSKASQKVEEKEAPQSKGKKKEKEEEEEEVFRWWDAESPNGDGTIKWQKLEHNGVIFPPPYEPLPSLVKMKYDGMLFVELIRVNRKQTLVQARRWICLLHLRKLLASLRQCWRLITRRTLPSKRTFSTTGRKF